MTKRLTRNLAAWRVPLGESGFVDFVAMSVIGEEWSGNEIRIHCLRLIGNSCADTGSSSPVCPGRSAAQN